MEAKTKRKSISIKPKKSLKSLQNGTSIKNIKKKRETKKEKIIPSVDSQAHVIENKKDSKNAIKKTKKVKGTEKSKENVKTKKNLKKNKLKSEESDEILTKKQLEGLKDIDPEFYKFLKQNDKKLLEFNLDDSDLDDETSKENANEGSEEDDNDEEDEKFHKPSVADLEVASDESDFEADVVGDDSSKITLKLLRQWESQLQQEKVTIDVIRKAIQAFNSALASISTDENPNAPYIVAGAPVFNGVVQLCVLHLYPAILRYIGLNTKSKIPLHKTKKWPKLRSCLRYYLMDLIRLIEHVSNPNILIVLLKHLHQISNCMGSFSTICKPILKRLIVLWSTTADETVRVLSFLCILKIVRNQQQESMLNHVLKAMYFAYVRNSKFVSPSSLPNINFMRRSLVEMFALDLNVSYQHAFIYIRQLAIHLRNAVILKKKDSYQIVYNWQYINSIRLWSELLGITANKTQLQPLIYPLITIIIGVIKLIPTAQYFPLRFHCLQTLITIAKQTRTFIPVLPLILECLKSNVFNKKHTIVSMKPMSFTCILRLNKSQLAENGFRDEVIENVCSLLLEYLSIESSSMAFSDFVVPTVITLKQYLKECKNPNYSRKLKIILDKIQENAKFIEMERRKINFNLKDTALVRSWEDQVKNKNTPLDVYYANWMKTHEKKKRRLAADTDNINDYDLPIIKRKKIDNDDKNNENSNDEVELFPSDTDDEAETEVKCDNDQKKKKKAKKTKILPASTEENKSHTDEELQSDYDKDDCVDIVEELDVDDW